MPNQSSNLRGIFSDTKRIINAHSRHFLALSVLFLLPISFSFVVYSSQFPSTSTASTYLRVLASFPPGLDLPPIDKSTVLIPVIYSLFVLVFALFAAASITHSTFNGFYGRPVRLVSSLKSVLSSFLPLLATLTVSLFAMASISVAFGGLAVFLYNGLVLLGIDMDYDNQNFAVLGLLIAIFLVGVLIFFQIEWNLATAVVVVESDWGIAPLRRSSYLVQGMKTVTFFLISISVFLITVMMISSGLFASSLPISSDWVFNGCGIDGAWINWTLMVISRVFFTSSVTLILLYSIAANTVLFMHCKALRGELASEIAEEFARDYISFPFDDDKVPHLVYVV